MKGAEGTKMSVDDKDERWGSELNRGPVIGFESFLFGIMANGADRDWGPSHGPRSGTSLFILISAASELVLLARLKA